VFCAAAVGTTMQTTVVHLIATGTRQTTGTTTGVSVVPPMMLKEVFSDAAYLRTGRL